MKRMSTKQYHEAKSLIKNLCCNYDNVTGNCWLMDGTCPQMISQSLICRYFRDVLLEDKAGKALKAEIMQEDYVKTCAVCGRPFRALSNRAKYCNKCANEAKTKQATERKRKQRSNVTH